MVDEAPTQKRAQESIQEAYQALHRRFSTINPREPLRGFFQADDKEKKDASTSAPLLNSIALLPASRLSLDPLIELLSGFKIDLLFSAENNVFPIQTEADLEDYAHRVAGTVAVGLLELIFSHSKIEPTVFQRGDIINAGQTMGRALQYVNIARDIKRDAAIGRVYIPNEWLKREGLTPTDVIQYPDNPVLGKFESQMLVKADTAYQSTVNAICQLPKDVRGPLKTTIESYMMIGEMVRKARREGIKIEGKLKVPLWRRLKLAWAEMYVNS